MHYKNYSARIEFDNDDGVFVGRIVGIADTITFHATNLDALRAAFHGAVDDYLDTCAKIGKSPH
jgi:predicted HicB family RNase H-like nuclease